jgi:hypothetical protein
MCIMIEKGLVRGSKGMLPWNFMRILAVRCMGKGVLSSIDFSFSIGTCLLDFVKPMILTFLIKTLKSTSVIR